jgi:hypothetical protein
MNLPRTSTYKNQFHPPLVRINNHLLFVLRDGL